MIEYICYIIFANRTIDLSYMCNKSAAQVVNVAQVDNRTTAFKYLYQQLAYGYVISDALLDKLEQQEYQVLADARRACSGSTPTLRERFHRARTLDIMSRYTGERREFEVVYNYIVYLAATRSMC
jgi:hypothetical protein